MNIYEQKFRWKVGLLCFALFIVGTTLMYTSSISRKLAHEERKKIQLWAKATEEFNNINAVDIENISFLTSIIRDNKTIPVILTDEHQNITASRNLDSLRAATDTTYLRKKLEDMRNTYPPIVIDIGKHYAVNNISTNIAPQSSPKQYVYYNDSSVLRQLKTYPLIQLGIIAIFLGVSYLAFSTARRLEQDKVWLGMAKETAHQLGTPLSSLIGWIEVLKEDPESEQARMVGSEIEKDIGRLRLIADRFSKIGSQPKLEDTNIVASINKTVRYIRRRASGRVKVVFDDQHKVIITKLNTILFDWVIENLLKNALDAMDGKGQITVNIDEQEDDILITVADTGKGIPKSKFKTVFEPGYSTKKRGWGLGLSLSKRIVEIYHKGKIFVSQSAVNKGTTFKILLPKVLELDEA